MSWKALHWAAGQTTGNGSRKLILLLLANLADEAHSCYPSVGHLQEVSELGESTVRRIVNELARDGLIKVLERRRRSDGARIQNRYLLLVDGPDTPLPPEHDWEGEQQYRPPRGPTGPADAQGGPSQSETGPPSRSETGPPSAQEGPPPDLRPAPPQSETGPPSDRGGPYKEDPSVDPPPQPPVEPPGTPPPPVPHGGVGASASEAEGNDPQTHHRAVAVELLRKATATVPRERMPGPADAERLIGLACAALHRGWDPAALAARLADGGYAGAGTIYGVLRHRLTPGQGLPRTPPPSGPPPPQPAPPPQPWCRAPVCDPVTRQLVTEDGIPRYGTDDQGQRARLMCPDCGPESAP